MVYKQKKVKIHYFSGYKYENGRLIRGYWFYSFISKKWCFLPQKLSSESSSYPKSYPQL